MRIFLTLILFGIGSCSNSSPKIEIPNDKWGAQMSSNFKFNRISHECLVMEYQYE